MAKTKPIITHTEILCLAIRNIEDKILDQTAQLGAIPSCDEMLNACISEGIAKLDALKEMYRIETGTEYI